jgi:hypothetical protein
MQKPNMSTCPLARRLFDRVERLDRPLPDVVGDILVGELGAGIDPGHDEHGVTLLDEPAHQARSGLEIEQVIFVTKGGT